MQIHQLLYEFHPTLTWPGFASVVFTIICGGLIVSRVNGERNAQAWLPAFLNISISFAAGILFALALIQFSFAAYYLRFPSYLDWAESRSAGISWLSWHGSPGYPAIGTGDLYIQPYGPFLSAVTGGFLTVVGPSIASSKIPGLLSFFTAQFVNYFAVRRCGGTRFQALTVAAVECVVQAGFTNQALSFGVRADPWLFLIGSLCALLATFRPSRKTMAVMGALAGIAGNLKLYAVLYVVPPVLFVLSQRGDAKTRGQMAACAFLGFIAAIAVPLAGVDVRNYLTVLAWSSHRQSLRWLVEQDIAMMCFLFLVERIRQMEPCE